MEPESEVTPVNSTARWPDRLRHAATLLRAEGAAVLTIRDGAFVTLFTHRMAVETDWAGLFGEDLLRSAHTAAGPLTTAFAAGRWGDEVAFGIVTRIEAQAAPLLCVLRHHRPFDAVEVAGACAAAALLAQALDDGRRVAAADSVERPAVVEHAFATEHQVTVERRGEVAGEVARTRGAARDATAPEPGPTVAEAASDSAAPLAPSASEAPRALRVLAVEDHPVMRLGIQALLEREGMTVCGLPATCAEAIELARADGADVALVDLGLPDAEGVEVVVRLHAAAPTLPIVAFSVDTAPERVRAAIRAGAVGYLSKSIATAQLVAAMRSAAAGLSALAPIEAAALAADRAEKVVPSASPRSVPAAADPDRQAPASGRATQATPPTRVEVAEAAPAPVAAAIPERVTPLPTQEALTARELDLLRYLAEGHTNKEIARAMVLAEDTVKKGVQTLIAKLGATDRTHAVVLALRAALIA